MSAKGTVVAATEAWDRVAIAVEAALAETGMSPTEWKERSGVNSNTLGFLRRGTQKSYLRTTLRKASLALGWTGDSIERVLNGAEPLRATPGVGDPDRLDALEGRVDILEGLLRELVEREEPVE